MDDKAFDELLRGWQTGAGSRRRIILALLAGLGVTGSAVQEAATARRCTDGLTRCKVGKKKRCVDLDTDPAHCGACGNTCGSAQACVAGACRDACTPTCDGKVCGDDGCGGSCGQCGGGRRCRDGRCQEPEDDGPINIPTPECVENNDVCSEGDSCCDPLYTCANAFCEQSTTCCGVDGASCSDECDCCGIESSCAEGTCINTGQGCNPEFCPEDYVCGNNFCGQTNDCCGLSGAGCEGDCDCCGEESSCSEGTCFSGGGGAITAKSAKRTKPARRSKRR